MARSRSSRYEVMAQQVAKKYGIPWGLFKSLIAHESGWNPAARSSVGAVGLTQLMPGTASSLGVDPFDPKQNLDGGARYLSSLYRHSKSWYDALRGYNFGASAAAQDPNNGASYARAVLSGAGTLPGTPAKPVPGAKAPLPALDLPPMPSFEHLFGGFGKSPFKWAQPFDVPTPAPTVAPQESYGPGIQFKGKELVLPTQWQGTHETDGLGWGTKTAADIMGAAGTPVGAPESGVIVYWHPTGAQGGGSMEFRADSGKLYWLGHLDNGIKAGTRVKRGSVIAYISSRHPRPHVHIDARSA